MSLPWEMPSRVAGRPPTAEPPYKEAHLDKAKIHTWLAWQNPPGRQLHNAIMERILTPASPLADPFMQWFQKLFEVATTGEAGEPAS